MKKEQILNKLRNDEHYYGAFGKKYLSNSDISTLLKNPLALGQPSKPTSAFFLGSIINSTSSCTLILLSMTLG